RRRRRPPPAATRPHPRRRLRWRTRRPWTCGWPRSGAAPGSPPAPAARPPARRGGGVRAISRTDRTALPAVLCVALVAPAAARAADTNVIVSHRAKADFALTADPKAPEWKGVAPVIADKDRFGKPVPNHRTEVRSRWTDGNLYLLYVAP